MIEFQVLNSPDSLALDKHLYFMNRIVVGKNDGDLLIDDDSLESPHIRLELNAKGLFVENIPPKLEYHVNGKRLRGRRVLKQDDIIAIGDTEIKIGRTLFDEESRTEEELLRNMKQMIDSKSKHNDFVDIIEDALNDKS